MFDNISKWNTPIFYCFITMLYNIHLYMLYGKMNNSHLSVYNMVHRKCYRTYAINHTSLVCVAYPQADSQIKFENAHTTTRDARCDSSFELRVESLAAWVTLRPGPEAALAGFGLVTLTAAAASKWQKSTHLHCWDDVWDPSKSEVPLLCHFSLCHFSLLMCLTLGLGGCSEIESE